MGSHICAYYGEDFGRMIVEGVFVVTLKVIIPRVDETRVVVM